MALYNGLARVNFLSQLASGQSVSNTFYVSNAAAGTPPDVTELAGLAADLNTWFTSTYKTTLMTVDTFQKITCYQVTDPTAPVLIEEASVFPNIAGTLTGASRTNPDSVTGVLSFKTPNASRRYRGHIFLSGPNANTDLNGDKIATGSSWWTNAGNLAAKFAAGEMPTPTWTGTHLSHYALVIFSKAAALAAAPSVANVSACIVDPYVHWLRSRERGSH